MDGRREGEDDEEKKRAEQKKVSANKASNLPGIMSTWWCGKVWCVYFLLSNSQHREAREYGLLMTINFFTSL